MEGTLYGRKISYQTHCECVLYTEHGAHSYRNVAEMVKASDVMRSRRFDSCRSDAGVESKYPRTQ